MRREKKSSLLSNNNNSHRFECQPSLPTAAAVAAPPSSPPACSQSVSQFVSVFGFDACGDSFLPPSWSLMCGGFWVVGFQLLAGLALCLFFSLCRNAILLCSRCLSFSTGCGWVEGRKSSGLFLDPSEFWSFVTLLLYSSNPLHCLCVFVCSCTSAPYNSGSESASVEKKPLKQQQITNNFLLNKFLRHENSCKISYMSKLVDFFSLTEETPWSHPFEASQAFPL